ncbi:MAG: AmmeMemoRadiSam system radical SAM enzyme [Bacteroidales bacterium]|nr:AmmeMemoRadiSam system radical SAM enzyme [Bacteroidales bacterium]
MREALFYCKEEDDMVRCELCPHLCLINKGKAGNCRVRVNHNGTLIAENYGKISGFHADPIEKKPLYHYYPGKSILSIGSVGCNLHCKFCQNYEIAQSGVKGIQLKELSPDSIVNDAMRLKNNIGIAYTYNEPFIFYEFMRDTALLAKQYDLKNVMVTNGFFMEGPLESMLNFIDAFSVDLKAFTEEFYKKITKSILEPIKKNLIKINNSGKFLEITNLIIPGLNDDENHFVEMIKWIKNELGENTVLHLSRYFPRYKLSVPATSSEKMTNFYNIAAEHLNYVYIGNLLTLNGQNTHCSKCNNVVISRNGYAVNTEGLDQNGQCLICRNKIIEHL